MHVSRSEIAEDSNVKKSNENLGEVCDNQVLVVRCLDKLVALQETCKFLYIEPREKGHVFRKLVLCHPIHTVLSI